MLWCCFGFDKVSSSVSQAGLEFPQQSKLAANSKSVLFWLSLRNADPGIHHQPGIFLHSDPTVTFSDKVLPHNSGWPRTQRSACFCPIPPPSWSHHDWPCILKACGSWSQRPSSYRSEGDNDKSIRTEQRSQRCPHSVCLGLF